MTAQCFHCGGCYFESQPPGTTNLAFPWMLSHECQDRMCGKTTYTCDVVFPRNGDCVVDNFGLTFHRVHSPDLQLCFRKIDGEAAETLGVDNLPSWGYALAFADLIEDTDMFRYAVVRSGWQHLNAECTWSEHD
jgi:hypothetical protein